MSLFSDGLKFLGDELFKNAETTVSITRNGVSLGSFKTVATLSHYDDLGNNGAYYNGAQGKHVFVTIYDFLFKTSSNYIPQKGDVITMNGLTYEVRPLKDESRNGYKNVWSLDDPVGKIIRTHAQQFV